MSQDPHGGDAAIVCLTFRPLRRGTLIGFCDLHIVPWRLRLFGLAVHQHPASRKRWVQLASRPVVTASGELQRDPATNKITYSPLMRFSDPARLRRFSDLAAEAVATAFPHAFDPDSAPDPAQEALLP